MNSAFRSAVHGLLLALLAGHGVLHAEPFAWGVNSRGNLPDDQQVHALWRIDLATGESDYVGWTSFLDMEGLALDAEGTLYGADDESKTLVTVSTESGLAVAIANQRANFGVPIAEVLDLGMTFTCDGELLVSSDQRETLFTADPTDGMLTRIGDEGGLGAPITDIAAWGEAVYGIGQGLDGSGNSDSPFLYAIDAEAGTAEVIGPLGSAVAPYANAGLAFDADGVLWALTDRRDNGSPDLPSEILRIDLDTGAATKVADADVVGFESLAIAPPGGCDRGAPPAVVVPTLDRTGLGVLALLLLAIGWTLLTQRR
ncbi:hypothetical protein HFP89_07365 [Wenzhouxiangella sp. XN79A]|uniref:hypothetical protein n=1 Tax=Wenzhouxiangella sp. XN79A TaxID=2724193 RepID=UPI00144A5090|nr:hypothetical protein [Wenzhouxiangella sp. XN79A]NKI34980.1 hypothetical protein [Wenzhouxiangella sp. XN79A]